MRGADEPKKADEPLARTANPVDAGQADYVPRVQRNCCAKAPARRPHPC